MYLRKVTSNAVKVQVRSLSAKPEISSAQLIQQIAEQQKEKAAKIVPWFLTNMPPPYFKQISGAIQTQHVQAIATLKDMANSSESLSMRISTVDGDRHHITFISSDTSVGNFHSQIKSLGIPADSDLANVNTFSALDNSLSLNVFTFNSGKEKTATKEDAKAILQYIEDVKAGKHAADKSVPVYSEIFNEKNIAEYISNVTPSYARQSNPRRFLIQREMYEKVRGTEGSVVHMEAFENNQTWVTIAAANVLPEVLLRLSSAILQSRGVHLNRVHLDSVLDKSNSTPDTVGNVTMLRLLCANKSGQDLNTNTEFANTLATDLKRAKWIDNETYDLGLYKFPHLGLDKAEVITALCSMLHGPLNKQNAQAFTSIKAIVQIVESHKTNVDIAADIAQLYLDKFNPKKPLAATKYTERSDAIRAKINVLPNEHAVAVLNKMLDAVAATLRSNFYNEDRYALSARVHPSIMATGEMGKSEKKPLPFGVFFVHGRNFNAFHNRFRDIARGGLRIVSPANSDLHALESSRQYDEVYGLSHAQQLKNKDIPEGGAKGVILVGTHSIEASAKTFAMRKAVKAFCDSMLDLMVDSSVSKLVDYYNKPELIYFGPDEQIIPYDIDWIIKRAHIRGYPLPDALMSSKADNGINHKEFGVTSEGIVVYLDVALRKSLGIDPKKQPFTVKITGGPDGDVAGNLIRILNRDYGANAKIVGIADGFGVAEDPAGLDHTELLRLFKAELPITSFNPAKLNKGGIVLPVTNEEGFNRRNTMHNRIKADAFVPAGGRPNTINADNWQNFLDEKGEPTSKLIVEGANIFITPEARKNLFEKAKVAIVKDSSANKCGVVTSSCEVQGSMLMSKAEFMKIKPEIVNDVLTHLRKIARSEAELLFREYANYPGALPDFSERISKAIAKVDDAISAALENVGPEDPLFKELQPLIREGLPKKMVEVAGDRINKNFPVPYQKNAIACALASKLVYQEGIHLVEIQPTEKLAERAFQYYRQDQKIKELTAELNNTTGPLSPERKAVIVDILSRAGARASLNIF